MMFVSQAVAENITVNSVLTPLEVVLPDQAKKNQLIDKGDYYYLNTGKKALFVRQKDLFLVMQKKQVRTSVVELSASIKNKFSGQVKVIKNHLFEGSTMIRLLGNDNLSKGGIVSAIQVMDASIDYVSPVFSVTNGSGQAAIFPRIIVKLSPNVKTSKLLTERNLGASFDLVAALVDAQQEYEYKITTPITDVGEIFSLTRKIMELPYVRWAEPVMFVPSIKRYMPNDTMFNNQWHLHNIGQNGGVVDADIDAPEGWDLSKGNGAVVAIFDNGVQLNHPDLSIWSNPGETGGGKETNGIDDDGNGYVDDHQGWDFGGGDNDPSPSASGDNHGTAVAGVAAAHGNNALGVTGSAINADIFPVKSGSMSCTDWGNAMRYAGKYSDVVNNSWGISSCQSSLNSAINDVVSGNIPGARRGTKGTPVLFATGNSASGWRRFSLSGFSAGTYAFSWEYVKDGSTSDGYDAAWLDSITWPGGVNNSFETDTVGALPAGFTGSGDDNWSVVSDGTHARGASGKSVKTGNITHSQATQLNVSKAVGAGTLYYWIWVSSEQNYDFFNFYVNGALYHHYASGQYGHRNNVGYPASNPDTIAIGGSQDGGPGAVEERTYYSQFGPEVDVIAPTSGGFQGVTTTDRTGADGYAAGDYTSGFGGTSSATPLTAGVVADILSYSPSLTALQLRGVLRSGTDKIGPYSYLSGRNDYYGYGRVNLLKTLQNAVQTGKNEVVKRAEVAKPILQKKYGSGYIPPMATGASYSDVLASDFNARWIEKLKTDSISDGCVASKYCPDMVVTKEQLAKLLLKAKLGSGYVPPVATGSVYSDISTASFAARWIEDLNARGIALGCDSSNFCPKEAVTLEGFEKMLNKAFP